MNITLSLFAGAGAQFFDNNGVPLAGGKIYTYVAGTTTPLATYTTASDVAFHTNPIVLDAAGRIPSGGEIWLASGIGYKFVVKTSSDALVATYDKIPSSAQPPAANDADSIMYEQGYLVTAGSFVAGKIYRIVSIGTTDYTAIGAVDNTLGLHFVATGVGTGTGTAEFSQTVQNRLQQQVTTADFGAVGNGVANDTTAWTELNNQANTKVIASGTYLVNGDVYDYTDGGFITGKLVASQKGWNPYSDPIFGRTTPETALIALGGHYDEAGGVGVNYQWGISSWITNPGTMPVTNIDAVAQGWKVRGGGMAARQCGDGGDAHALELLSGQWAAKATVNTTSGSAILAVTDVTFKGSKFCVGNQISGTGIPGGSTIVSVTQDGNTTTISGEGYGYPGTIVISAPATVTGTTDITVLSADTLNFALLISGSGDGGSDGTGNPNGIGIGFQSYGNAAFYRGINFGATSLRSNGTGIRFAIGTAERGISFESYNLEQALRFSGGTAINIIQTTGVTCTGSVVSFGTTTATNGINFASTNVFSGAAILLSGQNIDTDNTTGMKIGLSATRKIGFWNATPVVQPAAIPNAAGGTEIATINSILTALRNIGLIAT